MKSLLLLGFIFISTLAHAGKCIRSTQNSEVSMNLKVVHSGELKKFPKKYKDKIKTYLEAYGFVSSRYSSPEKELDEMPFFRVFEGTLNGREVEFFELSTGDTIHGPIAAKESPENVGRNGDGDFAILKRRWLDLFIPKLSEQGEWNHLSKDTKAKIRTFLEFYAGMERSGNPLQYIDNQISRYDFEYEGRELSYLQFYRGGNEFGGVVARDSLEVLGANSDGDFYFFTGQYFRTEEI